MKKWIVVFIKIVGNAICEGRGGVYVSIYTKLWI